MTTEPTKQTDENPNPSPFQNVDWSEIAHKNQSRLLSRTQDTVVFATTHFGALRVVEVKSGLLEIHTSKLPGVKLVPGFRSDGYVSRHLIPYVEGGQVIPTDVLSDRLLCVLRDEPLASQEWRPTGLRATPEQLIKLQAGSVIEVIKDWWFSLEDAQPVYRQGDRLVVEYLLLSFGEGFREVETFSELEPEALKEINWAKDGVQATLLTGASKGTSIDMLFSDFVLVDEAQEPTTDSTEPTT